MLTRLARRDVPPVCEDPGDRKRGDDCKAEAESSAGGVCGVAAARDVDRVCDV